MRIWLIEDDYLQADAIERSLRTEYQDVAVLKSESAFYDNAATIARDTDCVLVLDVMLRWADPSPHSPDAPQVVKDGGPYLAGFRCLKKLAAHEGGANIPVVVYSVLELKDVENQVAEAKEVFTCLEFLQKVGEDNGLLACITQLAARER